MSRDFLLLSDSHAQERGQSSSDYFVVKTGEDPFGKFGSSEYLAVVLSGEERGFSRDIIAARP